MRYLEKFELFERKNVGVIYHYTKPKYLKMILEEDQMMSGHGYISFSRNYDLKEWHDTYLAYCRISFDGNSMSDKFRIVPHLFNPVTDNIYNSFIEMDYMERRRAYGEEREERIMGESITGIKRFIIQVDIMSGKLNDDPYSKKIVDEITKSNPEVSVNIVDKFKPVKPI